MDEALRWRHLIDRDTQRDAQAETGTTARTGGDGGDEPVLLAVLDGPVEIGMAHSALQDAGIPAYIKQNSLGPIYGLSMGAFGRGEVWVPPALVEPAREVLIGIGLLMPDEDES